MCTVTLTLSQNQDKASVMDNNCVKFYPDLTRGKEVMTQTICEQTDNVVPIYPQNFISLCRGYNKFKGERELKIV